MFVNIILGPQGAGKDTQAKLLEKQGIAKAFSVGEILRTVAKNDKQIADLLKVGALIDGTILTNILFKFFDKLEFKQLNVDHIILTGFPRKTDQIQVLVKLINRYNWEFGLAFILELKLQYILKRLKNRYVCPKCGAIYNIVTNPPKIPNKCDYDGTPLVRRDDDIDIISIKNRLRNYEKMTIPVINFFAKCGCVYKIDASRAINIINQDFKNAFIRFNDLHSRCIFPTKCF